MMITNNIRLIITIRMVIISSMMIRLIITIILQTGKSSS